MNQIENLAKHLYEGDPIYEREDYFEFLVVPWGDIKDSYPATYEHFIEEAANILGILNDL